MFQKITDKHVQYFETYILLFQHLFCLNNDIYDDNEHLPELWVIFIKTSIEYFSINLHR